VRTWIGATPAGRHVRACRRWSRMIRKSVKRFSEKIMRICNGSDGNALCDACVVLEMVRPEMRVAVRLKKPAAGFPARAQTIPAMMKICR
jgi:hypothetical protein